MEDYLKTIYQLSRGTDGRVENSRIAEQLDVSPPSVSTMLKRLAERELIDHEEYRGVLLTPSGETVALEVIRRHRLLESFLSKHLDYDLSEVHDEADRLEHHISDRLVRQIAEVLDHPTTDPHGDPIPAPDSEPPEERPTTRLTEFDEGETVRIERIGDQDPDVLSSLATRGLTPGTPVDIVGIDPFGVFTLRPENQTEPVSLPNDVARDLWVRAVGG
jgi:DtxR family Mn-dependent transcriptional regulator